MCFFNNAVNPNCLGADTECHADPDPALYLRDQRSFLRLNDADSTDLFLQCWFLDHIF